MVDQIIDKRTVFLPGPQGKLGPVGPQGLPGVNAVDNDTAVAAYIGSDQSRTSAVLRATGGYANAMMFGADPSGDTDSAPAITAALDSSQGVYLPAGAYRIDSPIVLSGKGLSAMPGARITAGMPMDCMVSMSQESGIPYTRRVELAGGEWDGNLMADRIVSSASNNCITVRDCSMRGAVSLHADFSHAHGARMDHVFIDGENRQVDAVSLNYDSHIDGVRIFRCCKGFILCGEINFFTTCYIWGGGTDKQVGRHSYGFYSDTGNTVIATGLYLDCLQDAFYSQSATAWDIMINGGFIYANPQDMDQSLTANVFNISSISVIRMPGVKVTPTRPITLAPNLLAPSDLDTRMDTSKLNDVRNYRSNYNLSYMRQKINSVRADLPQNAYYYLCTALCGTTARNSQVEFCDSNGAMQFRLEVFLANLAWITNARNTKDFRFYIVPDPSVSGLVRFYLQNTANAKTGFMTRESFNPVDYESPRIWIDPAQAPVVLSLPTTAGEIKPI
jgi:hypothetical protein